MSRAALVASALLLGFGVVGSLADHVLELPRLLQFAVKAAVPLGALGVLACAGLRRWRGRAGADAAIANALLLLATLAFAIGVGEVAARIAFRDVTTTGDFTSYFSREWKAGVRENSLGFREREIGPKPPGVFRIAMVGDSLTYGPGLEESQRFGNRVEAALTERAGPGRFEVLNFGRPGAATEDEVEILEQAALGTDPDFVLLQWYRNDVEGRHLTGRPRSLRLIPSDYLTARLHVHSALYYLIVQQWNRLQVPLGLVGSYDDYMRERFEDPTSPDSQIAERWLVRFVETARNAGLPVGIVVFPVLWPHDEFDYLSERVLDLCRARNVPCLDLGPPFAAAGPPRELWVNRLDSHPGARANAIAAEAIVERFGALWGAPQD